MSSGFPQSPDGLHSPYRTYPNKKHTILDTRCSNQFIPRAAPEAFPVTSAGYSGHAQIGGKMDLVTGTRPESPDRTRA